MAPRSIINASQCISGWANLVSSMLPNISVFFGIPFPDTVISSGDNPVIGNGAAWRPMDQETKKITLKSFMDVVSRTLAEDRKVASKSGHAVLYLIVTTHRVDEVDKTSTHFEPDTIVVIAR